MSMVSFSSFRKGFEQGHEDWSDFNRQKKGGERKNVGPWRAVDLILDFMTIHF